MDSWQFVIIEEGIRPKAHAFHRIKTKFDQRQRERRSSRIELRQTYVHGFGILARVLDFWFRGGCVCNLLLASSISGVQ